LAVIGAKHFASDDFEFLAEFVRQLALPLKGEVRRRHNQGPPEQAPRLQLFDQEPRHDCLAGTWVVRQKEADTRQAQEIIVNSLQLVRERINSRDREREKRVVLIGQAEAGGLDAQAE
jgi:hypothetical protein